ncbi:PAS domain S-box protein [Massilia sp. PAMC28688]|uniref:hybrid sensor histidine kinase/response regulator n=1 Tax=Massilia sp. PAMC28688 TaxID=2861283 RepID=UPI001C6282CA|nr:PAS domain-containing sensor histidine kinase [Massilia sp. PAMC28688]QYF93986.1 PAS domain S-box protein [Massilia sp. PAMC28688]
MSAPSSDPSSSPPGNPPSARGPADEAGRLARFVASVTDYAIYALSPAGTVVSWNAGAERFKQYRAEDIIGEHFSRFYTDEDRASGKPARALHTAATEGKFEEEGWRMRRDGTRFWASVVLDAVRDEHGELLGFAKITRDLTERKRAQDELRASEEQFRLLVQGVTDYAIYMLSPEGVVSNWNAGAERIKGYRADEVVGSHFSRFYTEGDRAAGLPQRALATAEREGRIESEGWRVRKDGTRFWSHVVIDAIRDAGGRLLGFAKITRDITERRDAAATLERTREALFQSQKLEAIGKLTGGVAHDFNNLLNVIVSGSELLAREVRSPGGQKVLESIQRAAQRGATLTQQLLSFARQQPLVQDDYNLNKLIQKFEAILRRAAGPDVRFELALCQAANLVHIDAAQFEAAVLNLVSNARDAMPHGGTLAVSTAVVTLDEHEVTQLAAGRYLVMTVKDSGTGMDPEVRARAVEPFFTTKPVGKGTGLGLSQAYGLVQQSGGALQIASEAGEGTCISMYFPMLVMGEGEEGASAETNSGNDKALIVDDQPEVLDIAVELFKSMGYDVFSANSGAEALAILRRMPDIDVMLSDVVMPGMNGYELGMEALKLRPELKILLVSGYAAPELASRITDISRFQLIGKPYRMAEILKKLRQA